jgi:hypothetical protein
MSRITINNLLSAENHLVDITAIDAHHILGGIRLGGKRDPHNPRGSLGKDGYRPVVMNMPVVEDCPPIHEQYEDCGEEWYESNCD